MNGMNTADAALETLCGEVVDILLGTVFMAVGATACAIAGRWSDSLRHRSDPLAQGRPHPGMVGNL